MEILNILYSNNLIAVYLIGAILVIILIFIVISSMTTTPKENKEILSDPIEIEKENSLDIKEENLEIPKINDIVEDLYQKSLDEELIEKAEVKDLNSFLEEYDVPENVIEEVINNEKAEYNDEPILKEEMSTNEISHDEEISKKTENIEDMLKRLYDLRQNENESRKNALLNEIYDLKKQVDEMLKSNASEFTIDYNYVDTNALADYYLFNEDIEFPKLK